MQLQQRVFNYARYLPRSWYHDHNIYDVRRFIMTHRLLRAPAFIALKPSRSEKYHENRGNGRTKADKKPTKSVKSRRTTSACSTIAWTTSGCFVFSFTDLHAYSIGSLEFLTIGKFLTAPTTAYLNVTDRKFNTGFIYFSIKANYICIAVCPLVEVATSPA